MKQLTEEELSKLSYEEFRQYLFKKYRVERNKKRLKCFKLAWDEGHANGYYEVELYFEDFVTLIK